MRYLGAGMSIFYIPYDRSALSDARVATDARVSSNKGGQYG